MSKILILCLKFDNFIKKIYFYIIKIYFFSKIEPFKSIRELRYQDKKRKHENSKILSKNQETLEKILEEQKQEREEAIDKNSRNLQESIFRQRQLKGKKSKIFIIQILREETNFKNYKRRVK